MKLEDFIKKHGNVSVDEKELKELLGIKDRKYFVPKHGEVYYYVKLNGGISSYVNINDYDVEIRENNEVFRKKEEAEEHAKKQRFLLKMKRDFLDNSEEIDWEDGGQVKYNIYYSTYRGEIGINTWYQEIQGVPVATNEEWLEEYIEKYEEEIKRYYFEIKEDK